MEKDQNLKRPILAIILTPIMLASFVWLEEIAKGTDLHYFGVREDLLLNDFFVEVMFGAFILLVIGTGLLLFSRIEEAPRLLKYGLYAITMLCLISTIFVAYSLATVPRGGHQTSFYISPDTFIGNITRHDTGEYRGVAYQTVFTQSYTTTWIFVDPTLWSQDLSRDVSLQTTKPVNMSGDLHFDVILYRATGEYRHSQPFNLAPSMPVSIDLHGTRWNGKIAVPSLDWGSYSEYERMRLEGYKIGFLLWLDLRGTDPGEEVEFTADVTGLFRVADFCVDSSLQNGVAILLCGVFAGIYVQILGKSVVRVRRRDEKAITYGLGALATAICGFILLKVSFILDTVVMTIALYGASSFLVGRELKNLLNALVVSLFFVVISNLSFFSFHYFIAICITFLSLLVLIKELLRKNLESGWFGAFCVEVVGLVVAFIIMVTLTIMLFFLFGYVPRNFPFLCS